MVISAILAVVSISSCNKDYQKENSIYCDYPTGDSAKNQAGRIYKWTDSASGKFFYYIGNPDPKLKDGGFVPCNDLSQYLKLEQEVGVLVVYTGIVKLGRDAEEPLYYGIEITEIRKSDG